MIQIGFDHPLTLAAIAAVAAAGEPVAIDAPTRERIAAGHRFLKSFARDKILYGINTGFGPMAQYKLADGRQQELQLNLIRSHAAGIGRPIEPVCVRAAMLGRLQCLALGFSGVHPEVPALLAELLNRDILPLIPEHGGVGASGDLVQLAHLALALIGEGEVCHQGRRRPAREAFAAEGLAPIGIHLREGLALVNGTSVMTGIGLVNVLLARNLFNWMLAAGMLLNEVVETYDDHYDEALNRVKRHRGQAAVAAAMRRVLASSGLPARRPEVLFQNGDHGGFKIQKKVQEYYSLRCLPQILGPILDTLANAETVLLDEINSVSDNPVVDMAAGGVFHGGNFHGDYVSLEMDKLKIAFTRLSMLAERQLNFLMNHRINKLLPPFVNLGTLGLNLGMQGAQFTATSTVAENQSLANPVYVHSIPCNNENQDIVSMGTNAALMARRVIENGYQVLSVELIALLQAVDSRQVADRLSEETGAVYRTLRALVPAFRDDQPLYPAIARVRDHLWENRLALI